MTRFSFLVCFTLILLLGACNPPAEPGQELPYRDPELSMEDRLKDLIGRMTLDEKINQMQYDAPAIDRLGIPAYNWWNECLHGVGRAGLATVFPQAIGMAASWNDSLMGEVATVISDEARAKYNKFQKEGKKGIYEGLTFWSPNINIFRDPRWGRGQETYGEDPYLTSVLGVKFIKGLQGNNKKYLKLVATAKHFAVHSGPESSRHTIDILPSKQDLYETYLPSFEAAVQQAHVASIMCAYNRVDDLPCCGNNILLQTILRNDWSFDGYVVSDCGAIDDFYKTHKVSATPEEAATMAVQSGTDMNCGMAFSHLKEAVEKGLITEDKIDQALFRLFRARFQLGMFDEPDSVVWNKLPYKIVHQEENVKKSLQMARESIVLLKNQQNVLPLSKEIKSVAVIGPNADHVPSLLGNYHGTSPSIVTPLQGIREKLGEEATVHFAKGSLFASGVPNLQPIPSSVMSFDGEEGIRGSYYKGNSFDKQPIFIRYDSVLNFTWLKETPVSKQMADSFAVEWKGFLTARKSGKHYLGVEAGNSVKLYIDDSLYIDFDNTHHPLRKYVSLNLRKGQKYKLEIEYLNYGPDPQMHLLWSEPEPGMLEEALDAARQSDVVLLFMGLTPLLEGEEMPVDISGFAGGDRTRLTLPATQKNLIAKVTALGKPTILVLQGGSAIALNGTEQSVSAIVDAWYPGEQGGTAIADVLFGDYNPSGKLPVTFYQSVNDLPAFDDYSMEGRTYKYYEGEPLYPFGYGLSYTRFTYSNLALPDSLPTGDTVQITVQVRNEGEMAGQETVQLYVSDPVASVRTPVRALQGFKKVSLQPGETKEVTFQLLPAQMGVITEGGNSLLEAGDIFISVGGGQPKLSQRFRKEKSAVLEKKVTLFGESQLL